MTSWGKNHELDVTRHLLETFPSGPLSIVSDSYDLWNFVDNIIGKDLKDLVVSRSEDGAGGTLVVRPDSGDPVTNVLKLLERLGNIFGEQTNSKGYKVLDKCVSVIQGDGISYKTLGDICAAVDQAGWSVSNLVFGSGGALLQKMDRDTQKCAYKCCLAVADGEKVNFKKQCVSECFKLIAILGGFVFSMKYLRIPLPTPAKSPSPEISFWCPKTGIIRRSRRRTWSLD
jgi:nicotinamide phosphoribosyltransferase